MSNPHYGNGRRVTVPSICRQLYIWSTWVHVAATFPQAATDVNVQSNGAQARSFALIPSAPRSLALIPSAPVHNSVTELVTSGPPPPGLAASESTSTLVPIPPRPTFIIPSGPPQQVSNLPPVSIVTDPILVPSIINPPGATNGSNVSVPLPDPSMISTEEPLRPIPAPTTAPGDPDGHHEVTEPNFSTTAPCRGCSPVIEITATGWGDSLPPGHTQPAAEHQDMTQSPPLATITAGASNILISQEPSGGDFAIGDSTAIQPGQTITVHDTPIVIQTTAGRTEVVVGGTKTIPLTPAAAGNPPSSQITDAPILLPITIGSQTLTPIADSPSHSNINPNAEPNSNSNANASPNVPALYLVDGQTLLPGGPAITVSGTTLSLLPTATAIVVNGQTTTTVSPSYGSVYTTTELPALTLWHTTYTADRAGYYSLGPGATLMPGGRAVTISGTVVSLAPHGTAAIIQGSTSVMAPSTTIVTITRSAAQGAGVGNGENAYSTGSPLSYPAGLSLPYPTSKANSATIASVALPEGIPLLVALGLAWVATRFL